jgi:hypothetical protein
MPGLVKSEADIDNIIAYTMEQKVARCRLLCSWRKKFRDRAKFWWVQII